MFRKTTITALVLGLAGCAAPLDRDAQDGWTVLSDAAIIDLHKNGLVLEGPGWTATWTADGRKIVSPALGGVVELRWEVRDGKFCQELYRSDEWDCGDISRIAIKGDQYRSYNASGSLRDEGTIVKRGAEVAE